METFLEAKIPADYEIVCAVSKIQEEPLFTDELVAILFSRMKKKWLPLKAFKHLEIEETNEERLYLAYDPRIIDSRIVDKVAFEIKQFFSTTSIIVEIEVGSKVKYLPRHDYNNIKKIDTTIHQGTSLCFTVSRYYHPYLLSLGRSEEEANGEIDRLNRLSNYKWYRVKRVYLGNVSIPDDIDKFLDEFICINKDEELEKSLEVYRSYQEFVRKRERAFSIDYDNHLIRKELEEKVSRKEVYLLDTSIDKADHNDFLHWSHDYVYLFNNRWKALMDLFDNGWNQRGFKGYKEEGNFFVLNEDMRIFLDDKKHILRYWQIGSYTQAINNYLQFKWERDHPVDEILSDNASEEENEKLVYADQEDTHVAKKIRIDIIMDDIDDFLAFLEKREINRQRRKRYVEVIKDLYKNGWNEYKHNTFIDDNTYKVSAREIEVFVNGLKTRDFNVTLKDYEDTLGLYLTYRYEKKYEKPRLVDKSEAVPPVIIERNFSKEDSIEGHVQPDEKKIFVNIAHMDEYKSTNEDHDGNPNKPSFIYLGEPKGKRKNKTMQVTTIKESEEIVNISINFDGTLIENKDQEEEKKAEQVEEPAEEHKEDLTEKQVEENHIEEQLEEQKEEREVKERKNNWFQIIKVCITHFGELGKMIIKNVFGKN